MRAISRWLVCVVCLVLIAACSRGPGKASGGTGAGGPSAYARDENITALAAKVPFPLLVPARVPGDPQVVDATPLSPAGSQGPVRCGIGFGAPDHGVLSIVESDGGQDIPTSGVSGKQQVDVDASRHLVGTEWIGGYVGQKRRPQHVLQVTVDGVQVRLSSLELSPAQLVEVAASLGPATARKV